MLKIKKSGSHGFTLPNLDIGLDVSGKDTTFTFISHAHADHMPRSSKAKVYASPATAKLMEARGFRGQVEILDFFQPLNIDQARITFYPAGHILGSAMTLVESEEGNILYTGDFRNPPSPTSEGFQIPDAIDYLITEATFSLPIYRWTDYDIIFEEIRSFAASSLSEGFIPVFLAYSLGKTQELMHALAPLEQPIQVHQSAFPLCKIYNEMGVDLGSYSKFKKNTDSDYILITPGMGSSNSILHSIPKTKIAYVSGWAALEPRGMSMNVDKRIPLSDHIDFFELISLCEQIRPKKVLITHTPNSKVICHYLNERNIDASPLESAFNYD